MTNKELADRLRKLCLNPSVVQEVQEIADYIESLPDPTPTLEDQLRELVGKHECLSRELEWIPTPPKDAAWRWHWWCPESQIHHCITTARALTVVRGIVKGLCDEQLPNKNWDWKPAGSKWTVWVGRSEPKHMFIDTETQAIDHLLTELAKQKQ